jgi:hypothetical protein
MKLILLLLLLLTPNLCQNRIYQNAIVDEEFSPYLKDFQLIVKNNKFDQMVKNTSIIFSDMPVKDGMQQIGYCAMMFTEYPVIYVDRKSYYSSSPMENEFTLLHELGHCICNRFHTSPSQGLAGVWEKLLFKLGIAKEMEALSDGCPSSLMYPYDVSETCMISHYFYYLNEFKKGCN